MPLKELCLHVLSTRSISPFDGLQIKVSLDVVISYSPSDLLLEAIKYLLHTCHAYYLASTFVLTVLSRALDPPAMSAVQAAMDTLQEVSFMNHRGTC